MDVSRAPGDEPVEASGDASFLEPIDEAELARLRELPWISRLDAGDLAQLVAEYEGALREAYRTGDRSAAELVLATWERRASRR